MTAFVGISFAYEHFKIVIHKGYISEGYISIAKNTNNSVPLEMPYSAKHRTQSLGGVTGMSLTSLHLFWHYDPFGVDVPLKL